MLLVCMRERVKMSAADTAIASCSIVLIDVPLFHELMKAGKTTLYGSDTLKDCIWDRGKIVTKLFHIVEPDVAVFGQKDYQQWRVITRMVRDLDFPIQIIGGPICREADGLAMSSRNARLSPEARQNAICIYKGLQWAQAALSAGNVTTADQIIQHVTDMISQAGGKVDYVQVVDADNLGPVTSLTAAPVLLAVAAHFPAKDTGTVRLIDNIVLKPE